ncbi:response regulator [Neptunitalea lumnitzerae]|uniref:dolichyl-phosphate beta-glucosyltransferase n=1 Tax=Neptunitalea lumnitzerae TaxID=2965509 RepID=A0ABQ5MLF8_9FLAO|nr:response regulator [Neptunitalea sp. Y10]GLB50237.1 transcriptional regulator [Neptunitalea sp. Y10]
MKILAIDDQQLVILPLEKRLKELGYDVKSLVSSVEAIEVYETFLPDLVIVDINMPTITGIDIIKYIRNIKGDTTPIMVLSGNTDDDLIVKAFDLGVEDYMKKPLSLDEVCARVKRLIGQGVNSIANEGSKSTSTIIQKRCVGVVIPCYNEEERILSDEFLDFVDRNSGYHLCFVNDGSKDNTLKVLHSLRKGREDFISVYNCEKNGGKAEAVRRGMLYMAEMEDLDYIGFLDADLSTDLKDFDDLVTTIESTQFKIVSGSRIARMGADITKQSARQIISLSINYIIRKILGMNFKDTQCGAKIMDKDIIKIAFQQKFVTKWLFDVEIFMRMKKHFGATAETYICEQPLKRWIHADGSKLSMKDSFKIIIQLAEIAFKYRGKKYSTKAHVKKVNMVELQEV